MPTIVMFHFRLALLFGSLIAAVTPSSASDAAQQLEKTACFIFAGHENCRTVRVFDAEECIIKIYPEPLPNIDPTELACLRDEAQTKKLHLLRALPQNLTISDRIYVSGTNVIEVLVGFDGRGAALWQSRPADTFEILGDPIQTRNAVRRLATKLCVGPSRFVGGGTSGGEITAKEAFKRASEGRIALIDIRLPREWRKTGVGVNATPITMHQSIYKFVDRLKHLTQKTKRPIALICAEGVRSATLQKSLMEFGFKGVINVHDGMGGSQAGPGWVKSGLPVIRYQSNKAD